MNEQIQRALLAVLQVVRPASSCRIPIVLALQTCRDLLTVRPRQGDCRCSTSLEVFVLQGLSSVRTLEKTTCSERQRGLGEVMGVAAATHLLHLASSLRLDHRLDDPVSP